MADREWCAVEDADYLSRGELGCSGPGKVIPNVALV